MNTLDIPTMSMGLLGGLAIFLYGMDMMTAALKVVAGDGLKELLRKLTSNRFSAALTGAGVTAIIQSSSVTTVLVVGFISAGVMSLQQSIGVIMGANIGTTITAQVIAFKVTKYALGLVFVGWFPLFFLRKERWRQSCTALMGLGMIFLGMTLMSDATYPLRSHEPFVDWMQRMESPLVGVLMGTAFTALVQSSSATTGIVIMLASQGLLPLEGGIAICMGANIGTCFTAILASIGKRREVWQAVAVHVLFNVSGVAIWLGFVPQIAHWMSLLSPRAEELEGLARLAAETPRQIANAHTFFNLSNTVLLIGFTGPMSRLVQKLVPERRNLLASDHQPRHLEGQLLSTPAFALEQVRLECLELGDRVRKLLAGVRAHCLGEQRADPERVAHMENSVDALQQSIVVYLAELSKTQISQKHSEDVGHYLQLANYLENMGDTLSDNMMDIGERFCQEHLSMSEGTRRHFEKLFDSVGETYADLLRALRDEDEDLAREVIERKARMMDMAYDISNRLNERLRADDPHRLTLYRLETDLSEMLKRLYYIVKKMAKVVVELRRKER